MRVQGMVKDQPGWEISSQKVEIQIMKRFIDICERSECK